MLISNGLLYGISLSTAVCQAFIYLGLFTSIYGSISLNFVSTNNLVDELNHDQFNPVTVGYGHALVHVVFSFSPIDEDTFLNSSSDAYNQGYINGNNNGYQNGYDDGASSGYQQGYGDGYAASVDQNSTAVAIFTGICEVGLLPVNVFLGILNFEVFGVNIGGFVASLMTIAIVVIVMRVVLGSKQND